MTCRACAMTNEKAGTHTSSRTGFGQVPMHKGIKCNAPRGGPTQRSAPYRPDGLSRWDKFVIKVGVGNDMRDW
eukprot:1546373-Rhodomonas_salina.1